MSRIVVLTKASVRRIQPKCRGCGRFLKPGEKVEVTHHRGGRTSHFCLSCAQQEVLVFPLCKPRRTRG